MHFQISKRASLLERGARITRGLGLFKLAQNIERKIWKEKLKLIEQKAAEKAQGKVVKMGLGSTSLRGLNILTKINNSLQFVSGTA